MTEEKLFKIKMNHGNSMDPFFCNDNAIWQSYLNLPILSEVEKRLIALRVIVMSIYRLKGGGPRMLG